MTLVGLISDTHGLLRREVAVALAGVDRILHAGDVGRPEVLEALQAIAPVTAVRGNVDTASWAEKLPTDTVTWVDGFNIYMIHILGQMRVIPKAARMDVVVSGHSHKPLIETRNDVLHVNPGSAGPRRFTLPISVGFLRLTPKAPIEAWLKTLDG
jgi:putative phosphoesterase